MTTYESIAKRPQTRPRPYGAYAKQVAFDITADQYRFLKAVQTRSGSTMAETLRAAVELWMTSVSATGKE
ncbi:hypothetical protein UG55_102932 [Frankia sp. EI5c]|nr:hypothetical protein UG55_102932 [Frankia sp. EI5c]